MTLERVALGSIVCVWLAAIAALATYEPHKLVLMSRVAVATALGIARIAGIY